MGTVHARAAALGLSALLAGGCVTHQVVVPRMRAEPPVPGPPLPVEVAWRLTPAAARAERTQPGPGDAVFAVPMGAALDENWAAALPLAFARPVRWEAGATPPPGAAGTLEIDLEHFSVAWPQGETPWVARAGERLVLRDRSGELVGAFVASGEAVLRPSLFGSPREYMGQVTGGALRRACEDFLRQLPGDTRVRDWLAREGLAPPPPAEGPAGTGVAAGPPPPAAAPPLDVTTLPPAAEPPPPTAAPPPPAAAPSLDVTPPPPAGPPHRLGIWAWLGPWFPRTRVGQLDGGTVGVTLGAGFGLRLTPLLTLQGEVEIAGTNYSAANAPPPGFLVQNASRASLEVSSLSVGPRLHHRLSSVELSAGAGLALVITRLTLPQSLIGLPGEWVENGSSAGWYAAAGADLWVSSTMAVGLELRHLEASTGSSDIAQGDLRVGGTTLAVMFRLYTP